MNVLEALAKISKGRLAPQDIARLVNSDHMQLWQTADRTSAMLTEIVTYPQMRECQIVGATGEAVQSWLEIFPIFEDWARGWNCSVIKLQGRKGWKRVLQPLGFEETGIVLEKTL